jgi:3-deoxy-D-manno-octulosonic-acid transferase
MKIFSKFKQFLYLNEDFFVSAQKHFSEAAHGAADSARPKRIWLYAESLGEFSLAARITDIIKSALSEKNAPPPVFFISFKTFSALSLAQNNKNGGILYFFHPFPGLRTIFKKYASAVKPDYFISVQHPVSKKLVKELLNPAFGTKLIFMGISPSGLKKMDIKYGEREIPAGFSLSAAVSGAGRAELNILPLSLKYASCFETAENLKDYEKPLRAQRSNPPIVISFVSVHKKESGFILKLLREIISDESLRQKFSLKFIFVPRNIKNSRRLFKEASKIGLNPLYYRGKGEKTNGENKEKKENKGGFEDFFESGGNGSGGEVKSLIVDKYGMLDDIYPVSDIVYVGKSLFKSEKGGHNVLEPASYGKTVVTGSYAVNFKDIISEMVRFDAITETDEKNFRDILIKLIKDEKLRSENGKNGLKFCLQKKEEFETYFKNYLTKIVVL